MKFKIILFILIVSIFSSCTSNTFCPAKDVEIQIIDIENIWEKFNDAERLAGSTPRISLNQSIQSLQEIKREMNNYEVEECLRKVKKNATVTMNHIIDGYIYFLNDEPEKKINDAFQIDLPPIYIPHVKLV